VAQRVDVGLVTWWTGSTRCRGATVGRWICDQDVAGSSLTKQYSLVPVSRQRRCAAGKITVGRHRTCRVLQTLVVLSTCGLKAYERKTNISPTLN